MDLVKGSLQEDRNSYPISKLSNLDKERYVETTGYNKIEPRLNKHEEPINLKNEDQNQDVRTARFDTNFHRDLLGIDNKFD